MMKSNFLIVFFLGFIGVLIPQNVKIGSQVWMTKNLDVFYFRNGDPIPIVKSEEDWKKAGENKQPACCYYENDAETGKKYGVLYNWYAVTDPRGLAPKGWHIPSYDEWIMLIEFLGDEIAGKKMKSKNGWSGYKGYEVCENCINWSPEKKAGEKCKICNDLRKIEKQKSGNGTDESGFSGLPGGLRHSDGIFKNFLYEGIRIVDKYGFSGNWWSSSESNANSCWWFGLDYDYDDVYFTVEIKGSGMSVRCIKD